MTRANKALVIFVVAALGLWGCSQRPGIPSGAAEQIKKLEAKVTQLEGDYHGATLARDQIRKRLADVEAQRLKAQQDLEQEQQASTKERDDLKQQLNARTTERDAVQAQFEVFRKGLKNLMLQIDTAANGMANPPAVSSTAPTTGGNS